MSDASTPTAVTGIPVRVKGLSKSFRDQAVLRGIDLEITPGELIVLMGPSGSGKSVFLRHLIGLETPDSGEVLLDGQPVTEESREKLRLAMVFQSGGLLNSLTVAQNVGLYLSEHRLGKPGEIARIVAEKLALVRLPPEAPAGRVPFRTMRGGRPERCRAATRFPCSGVRRAEHS